MNDVTDEEKITLVHKDQIDKISNKLGEVEQCLSNVIESNIQQDDDLSSLESQIKEMAERLSVSLESVENVQPSEKFRLTLSKQETLEIEESLPEDETLDVFDIKDWDDYVLKMDIYIEKHQINIEDSAYLRLLTDGQRLKLEKRIKEDFTLKAAKCDKYDYMIAGVSGMIAGIVDVVFVGIPADGKSKAKSDDMVDGIVIRAAKVLGWKEGKGSDRKRSALGFLERMSKINYDQRHGEDVKRQFRMSTKNHHLKSLAHSPDIIGLISSIIGQFTNKAHFFSDGEIISIDTSTFELRGDTFIAKVFSGFCNWFLHLLSDVAGSSGAKFRGSGIPIPFYPLLQLVDTGSFGQHRQTFAKIAVQVFERGYDFRHGVAMAAPVAISELLTELMWVVKTKFILKQELAEWFPSSNIPEVRRMLLISHGTLCVIDAGDSAIRSNGNIINFMLRSNLVAWARFGTIALKEISTLYKCNSIDRGAVNEYLDAEYRRMLEASR
jgi:hypothetical protein